MSRTLRSGNQYGNRNIQETKPKTRRTKKEWVREHTEQDARALLQAYILENGVTSTNFPKVCNIRGDLYTDSWAPSNLKGDTLYF